MKAGETVKAIETAREEGRQEVLDLLRDETRWSLSGYVSEVADAIERELGDGD
jgi:hypothetical protein